MNLEQKLEAVQNQLNEIKSELEANKRKQEEVKKLNWPEKIEAGMLFRKDCGSIYIAHTCEHGVVDNLVCIHGTRIGVNWHFRKLFAGDEEQFTYIGHARDLIKIEDATHEPTGAELVGRVCEFSDNGVSWTKPMICDDFCSQGIRARYFPRSGDWYTHARLAQ